MFLKTEINPVLPFHSYLISPHRIYNVFSLMVYSGELIYMYTQVNRASYSAIQKLKEL